MPSWPVRPVPIDNVKFDLNCDLGENEPRQRTEKLLRYVTSANIACGGHAGTVQAMKFAVKLAGERGVKIGAHPGLADRQNFGRVAAPLTAGELKLLLVHQVSALEKIANSAGGLLHHIKLHGALYHMVENQTPLLQAYLEVVKEFWADCVVIGLAGGRTIAEAAKAGLKVWPEGFLDRAYLDALHLVPREQAGAIIEAEEFDERIESIMGDGTVRGMRSNRRFRISAKTWCIHSEGVNAVRSARKARHYFSEIR